MMAPAMHLARADNRLHLRTTLRVLESGQTAENKQTRHLPKAVCKQIGPLTNKSLCQVTIRDRKNEQHEGSSWW